MGRQEGKEGKELGNTGNWSEMGGRARVGGHRARRSAGQCEGAGSGEWCAE